ncbi:MAG: ferredoxin:glutaredoxin reductase [Dehalococcoidia bacterium]|nr:ferredoxin:glutaredoxin reductase [Dehalococcoidia bacterium]
MADTDITPEAVDRAYLIYKREAESGGYHLNPDTEFTKGLINGLLVNERRYGYQSCPCRLASGTKDDDLDIICPCDYRDQDIDEQGACYCALYVSQKVIDGTMELHSIPDRRRSQKEGKTSAKAGAAALTEDLSYPIWRCKVCGYLCARDGPPEVCPICKAKKDRFERFL